MDKDGAPVSATYKLVNGSETFSSPINASNSLFSDRVAVLFAENTKVVSQDIVTVHLGTQQLIISPTDTQYNPITVTISVSAPDTLGTANNEYDLLVIENANQRGLPPQLIKSIIAQESTNKFNPTAYRYEPKTSDLKVFQNAALLNDARYRSFVFRQTRNDMAFSASSPRSIYKVNFNGKILQNIPDNYETTVKTNQFTPLMARNIFENNNSIQNWFIPINLYEMDEQFKEIALELEYQKYKFIAQTVIASSYGLMQLMYSTAVNDCNFKEVNGTGKNPIQLFDPAININCGSLHFLKKYKKINGGIVVTDFSSFESNLRSALASYNGGKRQKDNPDDGGDNYHSKVWKLLQKFSPIVNPN